VSSTITAEAWPAYAGPQPAVSPWRGTMLVWRTEMRKLTRQFWPRAGTVLCLLMPFGVAAVLRTQTSTPGDTLFGQWVHTSGFAIPMVILGFGGVFILPIMPAVVAGDIFSADDHHGTWKTVLTRSRSRGELFAGKFLTALTFPVIMLALVTISAVLAGYLCGTQPVVGVSGQLVPAGHATWLVIASYLAEIPPMLAFTALAMVASVVSRNTVVGMGTPVVLTLVLQVVALISLPAVVQVSMLSTPFLTWRGFWAQPAFFGPFEVGLIVSAAWFAVCSGVAWLVFRRRNIGVA
jgi:ABC-2 type transport system permease protein